MFGNHIRWHWRRNRGASCPPGRKPGANIVLCPPGNYPTCLVFRHEKSHQQSSWQVHPPFHFCVCYAKIESLYRFTAFETTIIVKSLKIGGIFFDPIIFILWVLLDKKSSDVPGRQWLANGVICRLTRRRWLWLWRHRRMNVACTQTTRHRQRARPLTVKHLLLPSSCVVQTKPWSSNQLLMPPMVKR